MTTTSADVEHPRSSQKRAKRASFAARIPGVAQFAELIQRVARVRHGRVPTGLLALLPVSIFVDLVDSPLDLFGGPLSMAVAFVLESAFLLGLTGKAGYAFLFSGIDLVPGLDLVPFATLTLVKEIAKAWRGEGWREPVVVAGPIIDV